MVYNFQSSLWTHLQQFSTTKNSLVHRIPLGQWHIELDQSPRISIKRCYSTSTAHGSTSWPPFSKFLQGILKYWCWCQKKSKHPPSASGTEKQKQVVKQLSWQSFWPGAGRPGFGLGCSYSWLLSAQLYGSQSYLDKKCLWKTRHENTHFIVESTNSIIDIRKSAH